MSEPHTMMWLTIVQYDVSRAICTVTTITRIVATTLPSSMWSEST